MTWSATGVHGHGITGVEPQGLERPAGPGIAAAPSQTRGGETNVAEDGVRDVLRGVHPDAMPDRAEWTAVDLSVAVVESVARGLPPTGRAASRVLAVLNDRRLKSGSGCPDPCGPSSEESGCVMYEPKCGTV